MRRVMMAAAALLVLAAPAAAQSQGTAPGFPTGWQGRLDRETLKLSDVMFMSMGGGFHVKTGPHAILWNPANTATGNYRLSASFTQPKPTAHREGFGLIAGGRNLTAANQDYLYFLISQDGHFMVRHRAGTEIHTLANWTPHAAIKAPTATTGADNTLVIESNPTHARFLVNGQEVFSIARAPMLNTDGIVGLRVGHNNEVMVRDFAVQRFTPSPSK